ncbi:MAG: hypothetical protein CME62_05930 [Halobacteriovoraceae bacterium]|nr:hypothetical protein [Halobacteriovoraceae bacterium]|tara:strand:- start:418 stop:1341 length:924 start_codon:yes stop_codon:yes gene_type:complete
MTKLRKPRTTKGPNFKWAGEPNLLAFYCFKAKIGRENRKKVADKLGIELNVLDARINHFVSQTPHSKSVSHTPSHEVVDIFKNNQTTGEESYLRLREYLGSDFIEEETNEDIDESEIEVTPVTNIPDLNKIFKNYWKIQKEYQLLNMDHMEWRDLVKVSSTMNIKSRGIKIEKRIINLNQWKKSVMSEQGDAWLNNGDGVEIKTSFITPLKGSSVSISGLRLWEEKVMYYLMIIIDISDTHIEPRTYFYWISKEQLHELDTQKRLGIPGMKKNDAIGNKNIPKSLNIKKYELEDWLKIYPVPKDFKF